MNTQSDGLNSQLAQRDAALLEKQEELDAQRGMLSAAIEELVKKNKSLEQALESLKDRNIELENLLYQSSHGLRSPLTSVMGMIQLLRYESLSETTKLHIDHIERKSSQMIEIMSSLTCLAQLSTERLTIEKIDLDAIIEKNIHYFKKTATFKNVEIEYIPSERNTFIDGDSYLLNEVIKQIMMNSLTFRDTEKSGTLLIRTRIEEQLVTIEIEDDGVGIEPDMSDKIFEMFYRGSEKSVGSGLGLYIVKKAIELQKGSISFSTSQNGTVFEINVPTVAPL